MGDLLFGTSSWSEKSWVGSFYPAGTKPAGMLRRYAETFRTVEADSTYYRSPPRSMVARWASETPDGFVLSAKFPRAIVHGGEAATPDPASLLVWEKVGDETGKFLDAMTQLGPKCGPLVLQFPYFNGSAFAGPEPFLERLDAYLGKLPPGFPYGVEVRNKGWIGEPLLGILRARRAALVLVDLAYMPHPADVADALDPVTADFAYARLIGDRKATEALTETWDRVVLDQKPRLERWAGLLQALRKRVPKTYVYANNHYAGHAPATVRELVEMVRG
ncbi:MAG: DUF72 domain-containing protein [Planctomycetales bacterium]|nr:DUF72 domain-containing protein [Planctomycetales bacterium]